MSRGGERKGAGRKKGSLSKRRQALIEDAVAAGLLPVEYMLQVLRDPNADVKRRDAMAIAAAPYTTPRLAAIEHSGDKDNPLALTAITVEFVKATPADTRRLLPPNDETGGSSV